MKMKVSIVIVAVAMSCILLADDAVASRFRRSASLQLTSAPSLVIHNVTEELTIDCRPPASLTDIEQFFTVFIEGAGDSGLPIASQSSSTKVLVEDKRISAQGSSKLSDSDKPFLTVTIKQPVFDDEGIYTCKFMYLDASYSAKTMTAELNVTVEEETPEDYVAPVVACNCDAIWAEIDKLKANILTENQLLRNQVKQSADLCRTSFSAKMKTREGHPLVNNRVLVFDGIINNEGGAYDSSTGAFTAPCNGNYFFTLTLRSVQEMDSGYVVGSIKADGQVAARTSVFIDNPINNYEASTNGVVLSLKEGQKITAVLETTSEGSLIGEAYSVFSGFYLFP